MLKYEKISIENYMGLSSYKLDLRPSIDAVILIAKKEKSRGWYYEIHTPFDKNKTIGEMVLLVQESRVTCKTLTELKKDIEELEIVKQVRFSEKTLQNEKYKDLPPRIINRF